MNGSSPQRHLRSLPCHGLQIDIEIREVTAFVRVHGELDLTTASQLRASLADLLQQECTRLDLDLADVPFCDVSGLNALIAVQRLAARHRASLVIRRPCVHLVRMMDVLPGHLVDAASSPHLHAPRGGEGADS